MVPANGLDVLPVDLVRRVKVWGSFTSYFVSLLKAFESFWTGVESSHVWRI